jgi:ABC-type Zn uptake system ZnuABC Zn-binding protein ZnuA
MALVATVAAALLLAACRASGDAPPSDRMQVVTSNVLLADFARQVGGDRIEVTSLIPPGVDLHSFQTTPGDSVAISRAQVIVTNGFGLDDYLLPVLDAAKQPGAVHVVAAEGLKELEEGVPAEAGAAAGHPADEDHSDEAPHFWQDPLLAVHYVAGIRDALTRADPANAAVYQAKAERYMVQLRFLDQEIAETLSQVPPQRRHLVTFHDAFGYFARRYGWQTSYFVVGDGSEASPGQVAAVITRLKEQDIPAVFAEPQFRSDLLDQAARDAGVQVGIIYSDVLDDTVPTYIEMMRFNARSLAQHLK